MSFFPPPRRVETTPAVSSAISIGRHLVNMFRATFGCDHAPALNTGSRDWSGGCGLEQVAGQSRQPQKMKVGIRETLASFALMLLARTADAQGAGALPWQEGFTARLEALALLETLNAELLSHDSATLTLGASSHHWLHHNLH